MNRSGRRHVVQAGPAGWIPGARTDPVSGYPSALSPLLNWYDSHRRRLPWRERPSPYRTWVSEVMLQQTQVGTVLPYYRRFLRRFPNVKALASARETAVLRHWAGLGYYSRARNLRRAARRIVADHGGRFPDTLEGVLRLPGVGRYTAGAILSIAFGRPLPVLDGNVARVLSRLYGIRGSVKSGRTQKKLWGLAGSLVHPGRPGDWNQAMMELGALVCVPESPRCGECPVSRQCVARRKGLQDVLPETGASRAPVNLRWTALWIEKDGKVLLWRRGPGERFLPGHWGLPEPRHLQSHAHRDASMPIARAASHAPRSRLRAAAGALLRRVRHSITHHRISVEVCRAAPPGRPVPSSARWVPIHALKRYLVSSLWLKCAGIPSA